MEDNEILSILSRMGIDQMLKGLALLFAGLLIVRLVMKVVNRAIETIHGIDPSLHSMIRSAISFVLNLVVVLTAASAIGIPITSFVALLSVVSLAVSLAVQGVLNNLAGGIIILASKPFKLEDYIEADSVAGTVKEIGILHTRLLTFDGKQIFVPNNILYTSKLTNYTANGTRRADLIISASYDNPPAQVRQAVMDAVSAFPQVLSEPAPEVVVDSYGDNAINYIVRVWTVSGNFGIARFELNEALYDAFKKHGVEMTYPHLNVHMK